MAGLNDAGRCRSSRSRRSGPRRERRLAGVAGGVVELEAERGDEGGVVEYGRRCRCSWSPRRGRRGTTGSRPSGPLIAPLAPPAHSIWATFLPPRSAAGRSSRPAGRPARTPRCCWRTAAVDVERVVRRAVHARPGAGGEGVPAGAGVRRRLGQQAVAVTRRRRACRNVRHRGHQALRPRTSRPGPGACRRTRRTRRCRCGARRRSRRGDGERRRGLPTSRPAPRRPARMTADRESGNGSQTPPCRQGTRGEGRSAGWSANPTGPHPMVLNRR